MKKVKALQDESGHWYVIPDELTKRFYELDEAMGSDNETVADEADDKFNELFNEYMTGGDINNIQLWAEL